MAKSIWAYLAKLPPIDWARIAGEVPRPWLPGPQPREWNVKALKARQANLKVKRRLAAERIHARVIADRKAAKLQEGTLNARLLGAMRPGEWYGRRDVQIRAGVKWGSVKARMGVMLKREWLERARNPDYRPAVYMPGYGVHVQPDVQQPEWLYRLTPAGEAQRLAEALK